MSMGLQQGVSTAAIALRLLAARGQRAAVLKQHRPKEMGPGGPGMSAGYHVDCCIQSCTGYEQRQCSDSCRSGYASFVVCLFCAATGSFSACILLKCSLILLAQDAVLVSAFC